MLCIISPCASLFKRLLWPLGTWQNVFFLPSFWQPQRFWILQGWVHGDQNHDVWKAELKDWCSNQPEFLLEPPVSGFSLLSSLGLGCILFLQVVIKFLSLGSSSYGYFSACWLCLTPNKVSLQLLRCFAVNPSGVPYPQLGARVWDTWDHHPWNEISFWGLRWHSVVLQSKWP